MLLLCIIPALLPAMVFNYHRYKTNKIKVGEFLLVNGIGVVIVFSMAILSALV
jgi:hypothetical protein